MRERHPRGRWPSSRHLSRRWFVVAALVVAVPATAATIVGTPGPDSIRGTASADRLYGKAGADRIYGLAGADVLDGGAGRDVLDGGAGDDRLLARDREADSVLCGPGRDRAVVDTLDTVRRCEVVLRPAAPPPDPEPVAGPVAIENRLAGTPEWSRFSRAPDRAIEAYTQPSAAPGDTITFHVSADPEASYRIDVYRAGHYAGAGARLVVCLPGCGADARATTQPIPRPSPEGLVHAGWPVSQSLQIPRDWVSGYYFAWVTLTSGPHAGTSHPLWFTLREAAGGRRAPILVQAAQSTWQAYNGWGGGSLYEFNSPGGRRAAKVSFDRPYDRVSPAGPDTWELPLVRFLERHGYDVAYQGDLDTARDPSSLVGRKLVIVAGHSEYWTKEMRDAFETARAAGTSLAFMGANAAYWQIRYEEEFRTIVGYKNPSWDPETNPALETDLFRALAPPRYECGLIGIQHMGGTLMWTTDGDYTVTASAVTDPWLQAGGFRAGDVVRGIVSREVDTIPVTESPENSCGNRLTVLFTRKLGGAYLGDADAVRYTAPSGAKVFASGSHQFVWGLEDVPEVQMRHGLVDPRLQRFVLAMLDDLAPGTRPRPQIR